jgi:hypothetical protein
MVISFSPVQRPKPDEAQGNQQNHEPNQGNLSRPQQFLCKAIVEKIMDMNI